MKPNPFLEPDYVPEKVPDEVFDDLVQTSEDRMYREIAQMLAISEVSDLYPPEILEDRIEDEMEKHRDRIEKLELWRYQKETGLPF